MFARVLLEVIGFAFPNFDLTFFNINVRPLRLKISSNRIPVSIARKIAKRSVVAIRIDGNFALSDQSLEFAWPQDAVCGEYPNP